MACNAAVSRSFQSTCHIRGMTVLRGIASIHVLFQSTCHIRGMTSCAHGVSARLLFQSTCHIRGMTSAQHRSGLRNSISIHMPHTWHDWETEMAQAIKQISIHMPHTWHDASMPSSGIQPVKFQSTCHIRGMTQNTSWIIAVIVFQSTCHIRGMTWLQQS